jgi:hypothetical protein
MAIDDKFITTNIPEALRKRINTRGRGAARAAKLANIEKADIPSQAMDHKEKIDQLEFNEKAEKNTKENGDNSTEEVQTNYRNTAEELQNNSTEEVQTNYRNTTDKMRPNSLNYRNTTGHTTDKKQKNYRNTTEEVQNFGSKVKDISLLAGKQKMAFDYLVNRAKIYGSESNNGWRVTPPISAQDITKMIDSKGPHAAREVIRELMKVNILCKISSKHGPGGWTIYGINSEAYSKSFVISNYRQTTEEVQTNYRNTTGHTTDQTTEVLSSSSSYLNNTTTFTSGSDMPSDWASILIPDFLTEKGFRETHIKQIYQSQKESLTSEQVQESLHEYSYDLENGLVKPFKGAVNLFLGVVRGNGNPWVSEALASAEAAAYLKQKKAMEIKKENEKNKDFLQTKKRVDEILSKLNDEEKKKIHPPTNDSDFGTYMYELALKEKIKTNILEKNDI